MTRRRQRGQEGLTLVECAAALALAALAVERGASMNREAAALLGLAGRRAAALDVARNLLEYEIGQPCADSFACPAAYRCTITRVALTATTDRIIARVESDDAEAVEELRTLAPLRSCAG